MANSNMDDPIPLFEDLRIMTVVMADRTHCAEI